MMYNINISLVVFCLIFIQFLVCVIRTAHKEDNNKEKKENVKEEIKEKVTFLFYFRC